MFPKGLLELVLKNWKEAQNKGAWNLIIQQQFILVLLQACITFELYNYI